MPYMQGDLVLGDEYNEHIAVLEHLLGHGATILDGHPGGKLSHGREDAGEGIEELVREAATTEQPVGEAPAVEQPVPVVERPPEVSLAEMEMRLRLYIDESEARIIRHFEEPLAEINCKMDKVLATLATLQRDNALVVNILREEHLKEEEGETYVVGDVQATTTR